MRIIFCLIMSSALFSIVFANESGLQAGAANSNITPKMGVPLSGVIMQSGPSKDIHDELWARCLVLSDGVTELAFAVVDNTMISREIHDKAKGVIKQKLGIPANHICISATHTHSTPRAVVDLVDDPLHREYLDFLAERIADGIVRAHNRLAPAEIGWGSFDEPRFVHNRRWHVRSPGTSPFGDSEPVRMNPGRNPENLDRPAGPVDPEVFVLAVRRRADQQPIAVVGNYGLHYVGGIPRGTVSADYFGVYADKVQEKWQADRLTPAFVGILTNGTSGDVNAIDPTVPRQSFQPYERMTQIAGELATQSLTVIEKMTFRSDLTLDAASAELNLGIRQPDEERLAWAKQTRAPDNFRLRLTRPQVYAREALLLADLFPEVSMPIQAFRIGDLAITQSPCETFAETGLAIKQGSPFPGNTFTIELANSYGGYLPPEEQYSLGGYETWPARSSFLEESAETAIREGLLDLLNQLAKRNN